MICVLIVDDSDDVREAIMLALEDAGYDSVSASDGAEALRMLRAGLRPKVMLLDLMMPVMSGWQVQREMRADPCLSEIPVVIITGDPMAARRAGDLGAAGHLWKPFEESALLTLVARFCAPR